jgi:hypothetical protein
VGYEAVTGKNHIILLKLSFNANSKSSSILLYLASSVDLNIPNVASYMHIDFCCFKDFLNYFKNSFIFPVPISSIVSFCGAEFNVVLMSLIKT